MAKIILSVFVILCGINLGVGEFANCGESNGLSEYIHCLEEKTKQENYRQNGKLTYEKMCVSAFRAMTLGYKPPMFHLQRNQLMNEIENLRTKNNFLQEHCFIFLSKNGRKFLSTLNLLLQKLIKVIPTSITEEKVSFVKNEPLVDKWDKRGRNTPALGINALDNALFHLASFYDQQLYKNDLNFIGK